MLNDRFRVQKDLYRLEEWVESNKMKLTSHKCNSMNVMAQEING